VPVQGVDATPPNRLIRQHFSWRTTTVDANQDRAVFLFELNDFGP
jgi:hypothetical protein